MSGINCLHQDLRTQAAQCAYYVQLNSEHGHCLQLSKEAALTNLTRSSLRP